MKWGRRKIAKVIWGIFCLFGCTVFCEDFYQAFNHPEQYPFGAEGPVAGIWYYKTQTAYLWFDVILICWFSVGILLCSLQHKFRSLKWGILTHCILTLLYMIIVDIVFAHR
jgi:hypothetical protein